MAASDLQRVVSIIFAGEDRLSPAARAAQRTLSEFGTGLSGSVDALAGFTAGAARLEAGLLATGAAAAVVAVNTAAKFDQAFRGLTTLIEEPTSALSGFRQSILDYAQGSTQPLEQITQALGDAIGSGVRWQDSLALLRVAEQGAVAGQAQLGESTRLLVGTLNAYGLGVDQVQRVSDVFFRTVGDGTIKISDLANDFGRIAPLAAAAGVPIETIGAALAVLTQQGIQPSEAVTYLRSALSAIIAPGTDAATLAQQLGIQFDAQALKSRGLAAVLNDVQRATGGNVNQMKTLFGSVEALSAVLGLSGANAGKFSTELARMQAAAGATQTAFARFAGALGPAAQQFKNAIEVGLTGIGDRLLDESGGIVAALAAIVRAISSSANSGNLKPLVDDLEAGFKRVQTVLEAVARNLPAALNSADLSGFRDGVQAVAAALGRLFGGADLTSVEGLRLAIEGAGRAFNLLSQYVAGAIDGIGPFSRGLATIASTISQINPDTVAFVGTVGGLAVGLSAVGTALSVVTPLLAAIRAAGGIAGSLGSAAELSAVGAALGATGVAVATFGATFTATRALGLDEKLNDWLVPDWLAGYQGATLGTALADAADWIGKFGTAADQAAPAARRLADAQQSVESVSERNARLIRDAIADEAKHTSEQLLGAAASREQAAEADALVRMWERLGYQYDATTGALRRTEDVQADLLRGFEAQNNAAGRALDTQRGFHVELINGIPTYTQVAKAGEKLFEPAKKSAEEAKTASDKLKESLEKIASDERIKTLEIKAKIDIADIEAQTERLKAAFSSIDNTVTSTGETLAKLVGEFADAQSSWDKSSIWKEVERESKRRDDALKLQRELIEAQAGYLREKARALARGDATITVNAPGLKPHLEAFMWEILSAIELRASTEGQERLLGVAGIAV